MPSAEGRREVPGMSPSLGETAVAERMSANVGISLSGSVAWVDGNPMRGATVRFDRVSAVGLTDNDGKYSLVVMPDEWAALSLASGKPSVSVGVQAPCWRAPRIDKVELLELDGTTWRAAHTPYEKECDVVVDIEIARALAKALAEAGITSLRVQIFELHPSIANSLKKQLAAGASLCGDASLVLTVPLTAAVEVRLQFLPTDSSQDPLWFADGRIAQLSLFEVGRVVFRLGSDAMLLIEVVDSQGGLLPFSSVSVWSDAPGMPADRHVQLMAADEYGRLLLIGEPGSRRGVVARYAGNVSSEIVFMIGQLSARVTVPTAGLRQVSIRDAGKALHRFRCGNSPSLFGNTVAPVLPYHQGGSCWVPTEARAVFVAWQESGRPREALLPLLGSADRHVILDLAELRPPNNIQVRIVFGKATDALVLIEMLDPLTASLGARPQIMLNSATQEPLLGFLPGAYRIIVQRGLTGPVLVQRDVQWSEDVVVDVADWVASGR